MITESWTYILVFNQWPDDYPAHSIPIGYNLIYLVLIPA